MSIPSEAVTEAGHTAHVVDAFAAGAPVVGKWLTGPPRHVGASVQTGQPRAAGLVIHHVSETIRRPHEWSA